MSRLLVAALLLVVIAPLAHTARAADVYANSLYDSSAVDITSPSNVLGAPNSRYADMRGEGTYVIVDMGEGEEGIGDLTLTCYPWDIGAAATVTFYTADWLTIGSAGDFLPASGVTLVIANASATPYRYVRIQSNNDKDWSLDAVTAAAIDVEPVVEEPVDEPPAEEEEVVPTAGTLIKSEEFSSVYLLGSDGKRHAFPNETVFTSWDYSFDNVTTITADALAGYMLGKNVTIKPATYLVKLQTNPKTYAVAPDATLRWVTSESVAISLYGVDWAENVVDVADVFWPNYVVGEDIDEQADIDGWTIPEHAY